MSVILASRPGRFRTEAGDGLAPVEAYDYLFCGRARASYVIAQLVHDTTVRIVDESDPPVVNRIASRLLPRFGTLEAARAELHTLVRFGSLDMALVRQTPR